MDTALAALCAQTVIIEPQTGQTQANKPSYGTPVQYAARIETKVEYRKNAAGDEVLTMGRCYLVPVVGAAIPRIGIDRCTLPTGVYEVTQPMILDVKTEPDENGNTDHIVLYFG